MSHDCPTAAAQRFDFHLPTVDRLDSQAEELLIDQRTREWQDTFQPTDPFLIWTAGQIALLSVRLDECDRLRRARRDQLARCAADHWDDDRRADVERLGASLAKAPAHVSLALQATPHGCQWLIERWEALVRTRETQGDWNDDQRRAALDLLGIPEELRDEPHPLDLARIRDEIKALARRRDCVVRGFDLVTRSALALGLDLGSDKILARIHREENAYRRQMQTALARFPNLRSPRANRKAAALLAAPPAWLQTNPPAAVPDEPPAPLSAPSPEPLLNVTLLDLDAPEPPKQSFPLGNGERGASAPCLPRDWAIADALARSRTALHQATPRASLAQDRSGTKRGSKSRRQRRALERLTCQA